MRKMNQVLFLTIVCLYLFTLFLIVAFPEKDETVEAENPVVYIPEEVSTEPETNEPVIGPVIFNSEEPATEDIYDLTKEEMDLIALVTMAEAEGESELGQRLVIDTILNRVDSVDFPDTVEDVIYQTNAFESMWNGRVDRCYVKEDILALVKDELKNRTNDRVVFFCAGDYSIYGTPLFKVDHHYFSYLKEGWNE